MPTVKFARGTLFEAWHTQACADKGIPAYGYRQSDAEPMLDNQWTTAYVQSYKVTAVPGVLADVTPDDVTTYGLTVVTRAEREAIDIALARQAAAVPPAEPEVIPEPEYHRPQPDTVVVEGETYTRTGSTYTRTG